MKLINEKALELLNDCGGLAPDDYWIDHSICVGNSAGIIASALNLDVDFAKTLGYIHDIGKRNGFEPGVNNHAIGGYEYIIGLGYNKKYASICLTHSFLNNDINCVAVGVPKKDKYKYDFIKKYVESHEYTIYEKIINLCDLICKQNNMTIEQRLIEIMTRYGVFENTVYHIKEAQKLKKYFDDLLGYNLYDLFPEIKDNL